MGQDSAIKQLVHSGKVDAAARAALAEDTPRTLQQLLSALNSHPNETVREVCAQILGERQVRLAVRHLLQALRDPSLYVRQEAFWAIEKILGYEPGQLGTRLRVTFEDRRGLYLRTRRHLRRSRHRRGGT